MKYYQHHIGDFDKATRHLTRIERSIYRDLIELYYDTEAPLTLDRQALCRKIIARSNEESTAVEQVLNEFFTETPTGWYHQRCESEIEKYRNSNSQKSAAGKASAAKKAAKRQQAINATPTSVETPVEQTLNEQTTECQLTNNHKPINQEPLEKKAPEKPARFKPESIELPDCIPPSTWEAWVKYRRNRKLSCTEQTMHLQARNLETWFNEGHDPRQIIDQSIANGWAGLFPPKTHGNAAPKPDNKALAERLAAKYDIRHGEIEL